MTEPKVQKKYRCDLCRASYDTREEAEECWLDCASPDVEEVFSCPFCGKPFREEKKAKACMDACAKDETRIWIARAKACEKKGQMRLFNQGAYV